MFKRSNTYLFAFLLLASSSYSQDDMKGQFKLKKHIKYKFGGRLMVDAANYKSDKVELESGTEIRRARLYFAGDLLKDWSYILQTDFAGNSVTVKAASVSLKTGDTSKLTLGNQLPPYSLQLQTSSKYQTFTTRAMAVLALNPDNSLGLAYQKNWSNCFFKTGLYGGTSSPGTGRERFLYAARFTCGPKFGISQTHFGGSYIHTEREDTLTIKSNYETHVDSSTFINTDALTNASTDRVAAEFAWVNGSFSTQAEFLGANIKSSDHKTSFIKGYYAFASWFITGDQRNYNSKSGSFGEIKPNKQWGTSDGMGALETALRYSSMDLSGALNGGEQNNISAELNWYPGGGLKFMFQHVIAEAKKDNVKDKPQITQFRAQITF